MKKKDNDKIKKSRSKRRAPVVSTVEGAFCSPFGSEHLILTDC